MFTSKSIYGAFLAALVMASGAVGCAHHKGGKGGKSGKSELHVAATGTASATPDEARVRISVETTADEADTASQENARLTTSVMTALRLVVGDTGEVSTDQLNLYVQQWNGNESPPQKSKVTAQNSLTVRLDGTDRVGAAVDAAVAAGANRIDSVIFSVKDPTPLLEKASTDAAVKARARAEVLAAALGMRVVRIVSVSSGGQSPSPFPTGRMMMKDAAESTPVQPGQLEFQDTVNITVEIAPQ